MDPLVDLLVKQYGLSREDAVAYANEIHGKADVSRAGAVPPLRPDERSDLETGDALQREAYTPVASSAIGHMNSLKAKLDNFTSLHQRLEAGDTLSPAEQKFYGNVRRAYEDKVKSSGQAAGTAYRNGRAPGQAANVEEAEAGSPLWNEVGAKLTKPMKVGEPITPQPFKVGPTSPMRQEPSVPYDTIGTHVPYSSINPQPVQMPYFPPEVTPTVHMPYTPPPQTPHQEMVANMMRFLNSSRAGTTQ